MPSSEVLVGPQNYPDDVFVIARGDNQGGALVSQNHGKYYETTYRGKCFSATNDSAVSTSDGTNSTWTGLGIFNLAGSTVNLVLLKFQCAQVADGVAATVGIMGGVGDLSESIHTRSRMVGSGLSPLAQASDSSNLSGSQNLIAILGQIGSLSTIGYQMSQGIDVEIDGAIIVPPGSFICSYTSAATTGALQFNFVWEEVPI